MFCSNKKNICENILYDFICMFPHLRTFFIAFREKGREREKHWYETGASIFCLMGAPWPGIEHTTFQLQDDIQPTGLHWPQLYDSI